MPATVIGSFAFPWTLCVYGLIPPTIRGRADSAIGAILPSNGAFVSATNWIRSVSQILKLDEA
jgi:hypothetical protein